jgi:putative transposase
VSAFIDEQRARFGVEPVCRTLEVSDSAYYQRAKGERSARDVSDERLLAEIRTVHADSFEAYGSRRTWKELHRRGVDCARCTVERLMSSNGIHGAKRRGRPWRTTKPDPEAARRPDLVERDFSAERPNQLWLADLTHLRSWEGIAYLAFVLDAFSRKIVGFQLAVHMRATMVCEALEMAIGVRGIGADVGLVHHSDRGSQYTSEPYGAVLSDAGIAASLGSVGDAYDNAMAESFVDTLKTELIRDRVWRSFEQLEHAVVRWIGFYNARRLHSSLGDLPPDEFEAAWAAENAADPGDRSVADGEPRPADALSAPRIEPASADQVDLAAIAAPARAGETTSPPGSARPADSLRRAASEPEPFPTTLTLTTTKST